MGQVVTDSVLVFVSIKVVKLCSSLVWDILYKSISGKCYCVCHVLNAFRKRLKKDFNFFDLFSASLVQKLKTLFVTQKMTTKKCQQLNYIMRVLMDMLV